MTSPGALVAAAVVAVAGLTACGSDKPGYCDDRASLEQSVNDLGNVKVAQSGGLDQLKSQLQKIESDTRALASSAKGDFPTESSAMQASVSKLKTDVEKLPSSPSAGDLAAVVPDTKNVVSSFQSFKQATDSKCSS